MKTVGSVWVLKFSVIGRGNTSAHIWLRWAELTQLFSQAASEKIRRTFVQEFVRGWSGQDFASTRRRIRRQLLAYAIPTDEELLIARDTVRVILGVPHPS